MLSKQAVFRPKEGLPFRGVTRAYTVLYRVNTGDMGARTVGRPAADVVPGLLNFPRTQMVTNSAATLRGELDSGPQVGTEWQGEGGLGDGVLNAAFDILGGRVVGGRIWEGKTLGQVDTDALMNTTRCSSVDCVGNPLRISSNWANSWYQALDAYTFCDYNESITSSGSYWIKHEALETILTVC